jgi:hypothetical protein
MELSRFIASLNQPLAKRISKLIRMFGATEEEAKVALLKLRSLCTETRISFNDIAILIENCNGEIEQLKYSDADAAAIYSRGVEKGRTERPAEEATEFFDEDGTPRWYEIAAYCRESRGHSLSDWERNFADDMPAKMACYGRPTSAQAKHLLRIFIKRGGVVYARVVRTFM